MNISCSGTGAVPVLVVDGLVGAENGWALREALLKAAAQEPELLVCDARTATVDPRGAAVLMSVRTALDPWPGCSFVVLAGEELAERLVGQDDDVRTSVLPDLAASPGALPSEPLEVLRHHLAATVEAAGEGRSFLAEALHRWGRDGDLPVAALIANELITNAILHARTPMDVTVSIRGERLAVTVADENEERPVLLAADTFDEHGRGMALVDGLAVHWGSLPRHPGGKVVWAIVRDGAGRTA